MAVFLLSSYTHFKRPIQLRKYYSENKFGMTSLSSKFLLSVSIFYPKGCNKQFVQQMLRSHKTFVTKVLQEKEIFRYSKMCSEKHLVRLRPCHPEFHLSNHDMGYHVCIRPTKCLLYGENFVTSGIASIIWQ